MKNLLYFLYYVVAPLAIAAILFGIFCFIGDGADWLHDGGDCGEYFMVRYAFVAANIIAEAAFYLYTFDIFNEYMRHKNF